MIKASKITKNIFSLIALILLIILLCLSLFAVFNPDSTPEIFGYRSYRILTDSMKPKLSPGDLVFTKKVSPDKLKAGDIITYKVTLNGNSVIMTHRIVSITYSQSSGHYAIKTKGDNAPNQDSYTLDERDVLGVYATSIPLVGYLVGFATSSQGLICICMLIFILLVTGFAHDKIKEREEIESANKEKIEMVSSLLSKTIDIDNPNELQQHIEETIKIVESLHLDKKQDEPPKMDDFEVANELADDEVEIVSDINSNADSSLDSDLNNDSVIIMGAPEPPIAIEQHKTHAIDGKKSVDAIAGKEQAMAIEGKVDHAAIEGKPDHAAIEGKPEFMQLAAGRSIDLNHKDVEIGLVAAVESAATALDSKLSVADIAKQDNNDYPLDTPAERELRRKLRVVREKLEQMRIQRERELAEIAAAHQLQIQQQLQQQQRQANPLSILEEHIVPLTQLEKQQLDAAKQILNQERKEKRRLAKIERDKKLAQLPEHERKRLEDKKLAAAAARKQRDLDKKRDLENYLASLTDDQRNAYLQAQKQKDEVKKTISRLRRAKKERSEYERLVTL